MSDSPRPEDNAPAQSPPPDERRFRLNGLAFAKVVAALSMFVLIACQPGHYWGSVFEAALAGMLLISVLWTAARPNKLKCEITRLRDLVGRIRQGYEPIELLSAFDTTLAPLAEAYQELFRDIRRERTRTAELQQEVRQRVNARTESLERTIGALRQQAAKDGLTGLFNRRMLDAYLPDAIQRCRTTATPLCLLTIDIDHFKPLNDTLGHAAGDQMLKSVAQIIRSTIRESDLAFRNGGDEFVIVLEGCRPETGRVLADRVASLGDALGRTFRVTAPPTLSIGVTSLADVKDATASSLLHKADEALYEIKAGHHAAANVPPRSRRIG